MCGIAGFVGSGNKEILEKMINSISYRGPDDAGLFFENDVGLGHRRLSIIDLSPSGHQPMFSSDKKIGIVFNGEIYNYKELKKEYFSDYSFVGSSDTEVIIALYQKFGEDCFSKMNGMFAVAIYDFEKNKLILARDRMGKKPLYWAKFENTFLFGSELKVLLEHDVCKKEIDKDSLALYLALDYVPKPKTILKDVYKLEPATFLVFEDGKIRKESFWDLSFENSKMSFSDAILELDKKIESSVKSRLVSDVPLGIFLSGGLDSSTVAYYSQKNSTEPIHTFSVGFSEKSFDESVYAKEVSEYLKTNHHHINLSAKDSLDLIPHIADFLDEPMADASIVPTYLLSKFTKQFVTVALGGDGGDELFAGYPTFLADKFLSFYLSLPDFLIKIIYRIAFWIGDSDSNFSFGFKIKKFVSGISNNRFLTHQNWLGSFSSDEIGNLLVSGVKPQTEKWINDILKNIKSEGDSNLLLGTYMRTYLMDEVMVKVDRASMAASLETRAPFLDYKLVDFVNSLPYFYKFRGFTGKYILKKLMDGKLPNNIINRPKKGFGIPLSLWLKGDLRAWCEEVLSREKIEAQGLFKYAEIDGILKGHFSDKIDNRKKIWNLLVFQMWYTKYIK